jgi:hypothetical protein
MSYRLFSRLAFFTLQLGRAISVGAPLLLQHLLLSPFALYASTPCATKAMSWFHHASKEEHTRVCIGMQCPLHTYLHDIRVSSQILTMPGSILPKIYQDPKGRDSNLQKSKEEVWRDQLVMIWYRPG